MDLRVAKLLLNGVGTRFKGPFKVYVAGLYVRKKVFKLDEIVAQPGPKRVSITIMREIDAGELGKLHPRNRRQHIQQPIFQAGARSDQDGAGVRREQKAGAWRQLHH